MSTMDRAALRRAVEIACGAVRTHVAEETQKHEARVRKARVSGDEPPRWDNRPAATSPYWVRWACDSCKEAGLPAWVRNEDVIAALDDDLAGPVLQRLLELPEFAHLDGVPLEIGWSPKACQRKDVVSTEFKVGKIKAVSKKRRQLWPPEAGDAPDFELELSLPFFLLGTEPEIERGLHELLAACVFQGEDDEPTLRKADISTYASTLGRYGISTPREAQAVAHAMAHPATPQQLRDFGFDPETRQGLLFAPAEAAPPNVLELPSADRPPKRRTKALPDDRPEA
jgi:hypothetical protein